MIVSHSESEFVSSLLLPGSVLHTKESIRPSNAKLHDAIRAQILASSVQAKSKGKHQKLVASKPTKEKKEGQGHRYALGCRNAPSGCSVKQPPIPCPRTPDSATNY
jgi:hypothetical protein